MAIVRNGKAAIVPVIIGQDLGNVREVLNGVTEEDAVILNPPDSLVHGPAQRFVPRPIIIDDTTSDGSAHAAFAK